MTECSDRDCQRKLERLDAGIFGKDGLWDMVHESRKDIDKISDRQTARTMIIDSKMPKAWLWRIILIIAPVTGIAMTILIFQATASVRFADKDMVTRHEEKICSMERVLAAHIEVERQTVNRLDEILREVRKQQ